MADKIEGNANFILTKLEQMQAADTPPNPSPAPPPGEAETPIERAKTSSGVLFCQRDAQLPGNEAAHLKHHWLKTSTREAGMGREGGGVPGGKPDLPGVRTTVNDHAGQSREPGADCTPMPTIDEACVNEELQLGRYTGRWLPQNNCQTFAKDVLAHCGPPAASSDEQWLESKDIPKER